MCALMMDSQNLIPAVSSVGVVWCVLCAPPVGVSSARSRSHVRFRWLLIGTKTYMHVFTVVWFLFVRSSTFAAGLFWIVLQFMFLPHLLRSGLRSGAGGVCYTYSGRIASLLMVIACSSSSSRVNQISGSHLCAACSYLGFSINFALPLWCPFWIEVSVFTPFDFIKFITPSCIGLFVGFPFVTGNGWSLSVTYCKSTEEEVLQF